MIYLSLILIIIAAMSEAVMDTIQFHYDRSIFKNYNNKNYWNPELSWMNKYKEDLKTPKFIASTTLFVFLTDAWHFFKFIRTLTLFVGLLIIGFLSVNIFELIMMFIIVRVLFGVIFTITYRYCSNKKLL
jgi:hypothetical protein